MSGERRNKAIAPYDLAATTRLVLQRLNPSYGLRRCGRDARRWPKPRIEL
jgi:hypothetical protein